jgi:hypothetical protein
MRLRKGIAVSYLCIRAVPHFKVSEKSAIHQRSA